MAKHVEQRRQEEKGFTLIELMVVVLIMGILMAIAIPTFLSTRGSAYDASAKSNATNAFTNEKAYFESNQVFLDSDGTTNGNTLDNGLPWTAAIGSPTSTEYDTVSAMVYTGSPLAEVSAAPWTGTVMVIEALSKSDNCFYIYDNEASPTSSVVAYAETKNGCEAPGTVIGASVAPAGPVTGSATIQASGSLASADWGTNW